MNFQRKSTLHLLPLAVASFLYCAHSAAIARAAIQYTVTDLGPLELNGFSVAVAINGSGQVAGWLNGASETHPHAFLWTPIVANGAIGTLENAGPPDIENYARGMNAGGQVVGYTFSSSENAFEYRSFMYNGTSHDLGIPGTNNGANGINSVGQIVVAASDAGYLWNPTTPNGEIGTLTTLSYGFRTAPSGINDSGLITGSANIDSGIVPFLWTPTEPNGTTGTTTELGSFGGSYGEGLGINANGLVTGDSYLAGDVDFHAFLFDGTIHDLGTLGGSFSVGYALNSAGRITGSSVTAGDASQHAFLYTGGTGMVDLNSLIDPLSGWELIDGEGINDAGQITGSGVLNGEAHAYLLTPVPEPSTIVLAVMGTAGFGIMLSRKRKKLPS